MDLKIEIYKWIKDYAETNKINQLVVGVSGGVDSAVVSTCLLYTSPSPRDRQKSRMPSSA